MSECGFCKRCISDEASFECPVELSRCCPVKVEQRGGWSHIYRGKEIPSKKWVGYCDHCCGTVRMKNGKFRCAKNMTLHIKDAFLISLDPCHGHGEEGYAFILRKEADSCHFRPMSKSKAGDTHFGPHPVRDESAVVSHSQSESSDLLKFNKSTMITIMVILSLAIAVAVLA